MAGLVVVGGGPLIGTSVVRRFARDGLPATVLARRDATLQALRESVRSSTPDAEVRVVVADVTDDDGLRRGLDDAMAAYGAPEVVVYNAAHIRADRLGELSAAALLDTLAVNVVGAVTAGTHVLPAMLEAGGGSLFFTGGMPEAKAGYASLSLGKAGLRTVADLFVREVADRPVHVATVTVSDAVERGTAYDPDLIADVFAELHAEPPACWRSEVVYDKGGADSGAESSTR